MANTKDHTIELRKVSKYYAGESGVSMGFSRIDLSLDMGEFVAITGESGSGKSTLLNVISGLDSYDEGELLVCGEDTAAFKTEDYERYRKQYIGNIFQDFNLIGSYSVYQNIELAMLMHGKKKAECKEKIQELIELVGLTEYTKKKVSKLSGGQKQRVAIARALAKEAPIIVADEPTGNLDKESADIVMKTLSKVSADRLVVIVTHNYEQVEPYVTRKLTMNDGRLIEDEKFERNRSVIASREEAADNDAVVSGVEASVAENEVPEFLQAEPKHSKKTEEELDSESYEAGPGKLPFSGEARLGIRNTFNLPVKFLLLLMVYIFVVSSVIGQYTSTKNKLHQGDILGANTYFANTQAERIVVTKADKNAFTAEDYAKLEKTPNVASIIKNDIGIDKGVEVAIDDSYLDGGLYPATMLKKVDIGRLPENDNEIVLAVGEMSMAYNKLKDLGDKVVGKTVSLKDVTSTDVKLVDRDISIVGVVWLESNAPSSMMFGSDRVYGTEALGKEIATKLNASASTTTITYGNVTGTPVTGSQTVIPSSNVSDGEAYIFDEKQSNYDNGEAKGKGVTVNVKNTYYSQELWLKVSTVITQDNIANKLGIKKDDYSTYSSYLYVSPNDYATLYQRDSYQVTLMTKAETKSAETVAQLKADGFKALQVKDTLTDITGGFSFVLTLISFAGLIIEMLVLFFISYAVIKLIMRSRNSYYATLRILGASKSNTSHILNIELFVVMAIACAVDFIALLLVKNNIIHSKTLAEQLTFLTPLDCVVLLVLLLGISLLIGYRYSKKIFDRSAMKSYREEV
ncbi:MAG: ABC transporter ATP-binding protein [Clostridiales bacterium]|jgi:ABC-type lipoprotein export system ATPase subunit|nr:ABC transporter ATP-binding protein [Clostridiales bacterium]